MAFSDADRAIIESHLHDNGRGDAEDFVLDNSEVLELLRDLMEPDGDTNTPREVSLHGGADQVRLLVELARENGIEVTLRLHVPHQNNRHGYVHVVQDPVQS